MSMVETTTVDEGLPTGSDPEPITEITEPVEAPQLFTVKVNGVEVEKTLEELTEGFMLKADYTRKTQTLAAKRAEVEQATNLYAALQADPEETLKVLAKQLGVQGVQVLDDEYENDPAAQRLQALEREIARLNESESSRAVDREVATLKSTYQVSDDQLEDIFVEATKRKIDLQSAYRILYFDEAHAALAAVKARKAQEALITESKAAAGVVHLGTSSAGSSAPRVERPRSVRESYLLAAQGIRYEGD